MVNEELIPYFSKAARDAGFVVVKFDEAGLPEYQGAAPTDEQVATFINDAKDALSSEKEKADFRKAFEETMLLDAAQTYYTDPADLDKLDIGFHNLWADDAGTKPADGKWYRLTNPNYTKHASDPYMTLAYAQANGIEIG